MGRLTLLHFLVFTAALATASAGENIRGLEDALKPQQCAWTHGEAAASSPYLSCFPLAHPEADVMVSRTIPSAPDSFNVDYEDITTTSYTLPTQRVSSIRPLPKGSSAYIAVAEQPKVGMTEDEVMNFASQTIATSAQHNADILVFPEQFFPTCDTDGSPDADCIRREASMKDFCAASARKFGIWLVCTWYEHEDGRQYNAAVVYDRSGHVAARYHKLFPVAHPQHGLEPEHAVPGTRGVQVFDTDFGIRGCLAICNDVMFGELWQSCAAMGAEVMFWPAAWKGGRNLRAYALLHNMWVFNAPGPYGGGSATLVDNFGTTIHNSSLSYNENHLKVYEMETERVIVWENFDARMKEMIQAHQDDVEIENFDAEGEMYVIRPSAAAKKEKGGSPVRWHLRQFGVPTRAELQRWNRKVANVFRARQEQPKTGGLPEFPARADP